MTLLGFLIALVCSWTCSMLAGLFFGGKTKAPLPTPCYFIGRFLVWRISAIPFYVSLGVVALLFFGFSVSGFFGTLCGSLLLIILSFLPFQLIDLIKRGTEDSSSSRTKVINTSSSIKHGSQLAFYIEEGDWQAIQNLSPKDREFLEQFRIGGALYIAPATTVVLQLFDSYGLIHYLVTSEHAKALQRISSSLQQTEGKPLEPVTFVKPTEIKNQINPPQPEVAEEIDEDIEEEDEEDIFDDDEKDDIEDKPFQIPNFTPPTPSGIVPPTFNQEGDDDDLDDITDEDIRKFLAELEAEDEEEDDKDPKK